MISAEVDYPSDLPLPLMSGRSISNVDPMQKSEMASGRVRYRARFASAPSRVSVTFLMCNEQSEIFRGWYRWELNNGVKWFNVRLRVDNGIKDYVAHFDGIYDGPNVDGFFAVKYSATLLLRERPVPSEERYAEMHLLGGLTVEEALAEIQNINTHWVPYGPDSDYYVMPPSGRQVAGVADG
ncbi:hypothetical protein LMG33810_000979 [Carnimonas sp. LMG 33810]